MAFVVLDTVFWIRHYRDYVSEYKTSEKHFFCQREKDVAGILLQKYLFVPLVRAV